MGPARAWPYVKLLFDGERRSTHRGNVSGGATILLARRLRPRRRDRTPIAKRWLERHESRDIGLRSEAPDGVLTLVRSQRRRPAETHATRLYTGAGEDKLPFEFSEPAGGGGSGTGSRPSVRGSTGCPKGSAGRRESSAIECVGHALPY